MMEVRFWCGEWMTVRIGGLWGGGKKGVKNRDDQR